MSEKKGYNGGPFINYCNGNWTCKGKYSSVIICFNQKTDEIYFVDSHKKRISLDTCVCSSLISGLRRPIDLLFMEYGCFPCGMVAGEWLIQIRRQLEYYMPDWRYVWVKDMYPDPNGYSNIIPEDF